MEEDYVSYELAKKLRECGFNKPCDNYYDCYSNLKHYAPTDIVNRNTNGHHRPSCSAPTLWQAWKWLKEVKNINTEVHFDVENREMVNYDWSLFWVSPFELIDNADDSYQSYEEALEAGMMRAVEMLLSEELT